MESSLIIQEEFIGEGILPKVIQVVTIGDKNNPLVVCVHGKSKRNGCRTWENIIPLISSCGFWVVGISMPGYGKSKKWDDEESTEDILFHIIQVLLSTSSNDEKKVILCGKSWGGGVVIKYTLNHPNDVSKLILQAPAFSKKKKIAKLTQPILLCWSRDDTVIPYEKSNIYKDYVKNITMQTFDRGGHGAIMDERNISIITPILNDFL